LRPGTNQLKGRPGRCVAHPPAPRARHSLKERSGDVGYAIRTEAVKNPLGKTTLTKPDGKKRRKEKVARENRSCLVRASIEAKATCILVRLGTYIDRSRSIMDESRSQSSHHTLQPTRSAWTTSSIRRAAVQKDKHWRITPGVIVQARVVTHRS